MFADRAFAHQKSARKQSVYQISRDCVIMSTKGTRHRHLPLTPASNRSACSHNGRTAPSACPHTRTFAVAGSMGGKAPSNSDSTPSCRSVAKFSFLSLRMVQITNCSLSGISQLYLLPKEPSFQTAVHTGDPVVRKKGRKMEVEESRSSASGISC